jgi:hypothetical protein
VQRQSAQEGFYVFLNYTGCEQKLHFKETVYDLLESRKLSGGHCIEPYGVRLVRKLFQSGRSGATIRCSPLKNAVFRTQKMQRTPNRIDLGRFPAEQVCQ